MALSIPYTFVPNTPALSAEVNLNFAQVASAVDKTGDTLTGTIATRALLPSTDTAYDLGTASFRYRDIYVGRLLDMSGSGAGQIKFPSTQNPSANANTLDDYAEGTWIPTDDSAGGLTFTAKSGMYVKIGRLVFIEMEVVYPATADGSQILIGGLPFAGSATGSAYAGGAITFLSAVGIPIILNLLSGETHMRGSKFSGATALNSDLSGGTIAAIGCYRAT